MLTKPYMVMNGGGDGRWGGQRLLGPIGIGWVGGGITLGCSLGSGRQDARGGSCLAWVQCT